MDEFSCLELDGGTDLLALNERFPERYPFLLESVVAGTPQARYDILFIASPDALVAWSDGRLERSGQALSGADFFSELDRWWQAEGEQGRNDSGLPFTGGWFLYLGYEMAGVVEPRLELPRFSGRFPDALAVRCHGAVLRDHQADRCLLVTEAGHQDLVETLRDDLAGLEPVEMQSLQVAGAVEEEDPERFRRSLAAIHDYILSGDVFQVNISRRWSLASAADPATVYRALRHHNPAPFAALARWGDGAVVSSSPERLVSVRERQVETRPIAGTRPRRSDRSDDLEKRSELIGHPKERAEHIMLIDLERNDLGRVCEPGSVEVNELMVVESYAHVHHIVSNVRGRLKASALPGQVIRAVFPGGTITGCPKVRCMEIIGELEGEARGPYTGSLGYLCRNGDMDLNILIRSLLVERGRMEFRAGAGIVADSDPEHELAETRSKAKGLLLALGVPEESAA